MVHCRHCTVVNTLDSAYCRKCGVILLEVDVDEAQLKLDNLIAEGVMAFNEGRNDEALAIAERAIESNPCMVSALSLAADVYSRKGDLATALEFSDRVVELNPDSDLDRIRRNQLRTRLQNEIRVAETPDRKNAMVAAIAAVVFVACVGAIAAKIMTQPEPTQAQSTNLVASNQSATQPGNGDVVNQKVITPPATDPGPVQPTVTPETPTNVVDNSPRVSQRPSGGRLPLPTYTGQELPDPSGKSEVEIRPLTPGNPPPNQQNGLRDDDPKPVKTTVAVQPEDPEPDPGEITISVHKGTSTPRNGGGGTVPTDPAPTSGTGVQALLRAGSQQFQAGSLSTAVGTYERALAAGADPISTNQRLGMIYERLGRNGEAINAYNRVIQSAQTALSGGTGNASRVQSALDTARQAVRALGG